MKQTIDSYTLPSNEETSCLSRREKPSLQAKQSHPSIEQAFDLVFILDPVGMYRYVSPSHQRILGYTPEEFIGTNVFGLIHPVDPTQAFTSFAGAFQTSNMTVRIECRVHQANGEWLMLECVGNNCLNDSTIEGLIVNARDITERTVMEETLRHQALHDRLTELPDRTLLEQRLEDAILTAQRIESKVALLIINLNHFKDVNDTFGHQYGDILLQQVGIRLTQAIHTSDIVARTPMFLRYSICKGETLLKTERLRSNGRPVTGLLVGTMATGA